MKICFVCGEYPPGPHGGIGTVTQMLARRLVQIGHQVRVIGIYQGAYLAAPYEEDQGVRVWRYRRPAGRFGWVRARITLFRQVRQWVRGGEVDLIEAPDYQGWIAGWPRLAAPVVVRLNGSSTYFSHELGLPLGRTHYQLERRALLRADFLCSVSRYTAERTREVFALRRPVATVLYNPVETDTQPRSGCGGRQAEQQRVVFSGTLHQKKGVVSLIQAWPQIHQACPQASLHLYGKDLRDEDGRSMQARLQSLLTPQLRPHVHFHGHVTRDQLGDALREANVAVFPSYSEAFALAPLEAMAHGCATIYTRRGSGTELIDHDQNGLLIDPDRPDEIAAAIVRLLRHPEVAQRLATAGQQHVQKSFAVSHLVRQNEFFYHACLGNFHRCHSAVPGVQSLNTKDVPSIAGDDQDSDGALTAAAEASR